MIGFMREISDQLRDRAWRMVALKFVGRQAGLRLPGAP